MSSVDGGSAAPPTADVPTEDRATDLRTPARCWLCTITEPVRRSPDHSGVAGEPEATPRKRLKITRQEVTPRIQGLDEPAYFCAPEPAVAVSSTPTHAPTPETPGAVNVTGGVTVPDEAVEAYRAGYGRSFRKENRTDRDDVRAGLTAAAPLIAARALREAAAVLLDDEHYEPTGHDDLCGYGPPGECDCHRGAHYRWLIGRADELERGGDRG